jgi:hypothetical protein
MTSRPGHARKSTRAAFWVAGFLGALLAGCQSRPPGPAVAFPVTQQDLGSVPGGGTATARFLVRNEGSQPLRILSVVGSCGCLTPRYPNTLPPGGEGEIEIGFRPLPLWNGHVQKTIKVRTDDPRRPEAELLLLANIVPLVAIEPPSPLKVKYRLGQVYHAAVRMVPRSGSGISLNHPTSDSPLVKPTLTPPQPNDPGGGYLLMLAIGPRRAPGDFQAVIQVATSEPASPLVPVKVGVEAQQGPVASPPVVFGTSLGMADVGRQLAQFNVFTRAGKIQVLGVETGNRGLRATVSTITPGGFYTVTLHYTGGWELGWISTVVRIQTDYVPAPVLEVPFRAMVRRG